MPQVSAPVWRKVLKGGKRASANMGDPESGSGTMISGSVGTKRASTSFGGNNFGGGSGAGKNNFGGGKIGAPSGSSFQGGGSKDLITDSQGFVLRGALTGSAEAKDPESVGQYQVF